MQVLQTEGRWRRPWRQICHFLIRHDSDRMIIIQYKDRLSYSITHIHIILPSTFTFTLTYIIISNVSGMNKSNLFVRRSLTLDANKENRPQCLNIPIGGGKASKRKPKLMPNNKIMQKLFPNFQTLDQERTSLEKVEPITFRKMDPGDDEERVFRDFFQEQAMKYQAIFERYMITERPQRHEIKEFLTKGKQTTLQTYRF